jgi:hypothetical protein
MNTAETLKVVLPNAQLATQVFRGQVSPWCEGQWKAGRKLVAEFRLYEDVLSDEQRGYYHGVVLTAIAQQAAPLGNRWPMRVWKEYFRKKFLGTKTVSVTDPLTGETWQEQVRVSTEDLGVRAYADLITHVIAEASSELGVRVPMSFKEWQQLERDRTGAVIGGAQ